MPALTRLPCVQRMLGPGDTVHPAADSAPVAVLVCHGMGQQVPFETLQLVAAALHDGEASAEAPSVVRQVRFDGDWVPRVETTIRLGGRELELHLYEAYWAPVTENLIRAREVLAFLVQAGIDGLRYTGAGVFERWMRGRTARYPLSLALAPPLAATLLAITLLTASYVALWSMIALRVAAPLARWPSGDHLAERLERGVTGALAFTLLAAAVGWAATTLVPRLQDAAKERAPETHAPEPITIGPTRRLGRWVVIFASLGATAAAAWWLVRHSPRFGDLLPFVPTKVVDLAMPLALLIVFRLGRRFVVQYVGDVAIYVSAHTVNRFADARRAIQRIGRDLAHRIYSATDERGERLAYRRTLIVGHSLGSVIAYDTLDELLNFGAIDERLDVVARTAALVTFGSPLDKTAFLFRAQATDKPIREALAATVQPLMDRIDRTSLPWINIRSRADWIAGRLDFYDLPGAAERVRDVVDPGGWTPWTAHSGYWDRPTLAAVLRETLAPLARSPLAPPASFSLGSERPVRR